MILFAFAVFSLAYFYTGFMGKMSFIPETVQGLILTTDGIINSYQSEQAYLGFIENIFAGYREQQRKDAHAELAEFLPRLSEKGSGDDLSVAIICRKK